MVEKGSYEGKELILVQVIPGGYKSQFCVLDLKAEKLLTGRFATLFNDFGSSIVGMGPVLYTVGGSKSADEFDPKYIDGDHHIHSGASCLELSIPRLLSLRNKETVDPSTLGQLGKWKAAPPIKCDHMFPCCATLGGRIYVVGGSISCIGETFNPEIGQWEPLSPPPSTVFLDGFNVSFPVIADEKNKRLLVHFNNVNSIYAYYPGTGNWDCLAQNFRHWLPPTTLVDDVLYFHIEQQQDCLAAYDLSSKAWLKVVYSAKFPATVCFVAFQAMLRLSNDLLCLANFYPSVEDDGPDFTVFQFFQFRVERTSLTEVRCTPYAIKCISLEGYCEPTHFLPI